VSWSTHSIASSTVLSAFRRANLVARPPSMNSVGNLILHLCGNIRQWISSPGGGTDARDRPAEFSSGPIPREALLAETRAVVAEAAAVLQRQTAGNWSNRAASRVGHHRLQAIFNSVPHFRGHTQEIIHITRTLFGRRVPVRMGAQDQGEGARNDRLVI